MLLFRNRRRKPGPYVLHRHLSDSRPDRFAAARWAERPQRAPAVPPPVISRRTIDRPGPVEHLRREVGVTDGRSNDPARYWNPGIDARELADRLNALLVANADPVHRDDAGGSP